MFDKGKLEKSARMKIYIVNKLRVTQFIEPVNRKPITVNCYL